MMMTTIKRLLTIGFLTVLCSTTHAESLFDSNIRAGLADNDKDGVIDVRDRCANTEKGDAVDTYGCPKVSSTLLSIDLNILFDSGKAIVRPKFYPEVMKLATFLKEHPSSKVVIEGYTDNVGAENINKALSQKRATAIADVLIDSFRISPKRVQAIGHGESDPIASNDSAEGRANNRRVLANVFAEQTADVKRWTIYSVDTKHNTALYSLRK
ncbi:OmpA family protein [Marinomonas pollencensis]|uniref:OmpA family protein n=1 Tax=Marinomonas pollencensis TaxID=491954 RepID=A0A3E0DTT8_9GAMM|nr:OmpA family protein [Marinomonas pollencensis]REG85883.1 OmpA family protein [Marinomonas pollencensis]